ncbi:hypothetical protein Tco_0057760, partial [Tanacetum coccineum]
KVVTSTGFKPGFFARSCYMSEINLYMESWLLKCNYRAQEAPCGLYCLFTLSTANVIQGSTRVSTVLTCVCYQEKGCIVTTVGDKYDTKKKMQSCTNGLERSSQGLEYKMASISGLFFVILLSTAHSFTDGLNDLRSSNKLHSMDWLDNYKAEIICHEKVVRIPLPDGKVLRVLGERPEENARLLMSAKANEKNQE